MDLRIENHIIDNFASIWRIVEASWCIIDMLPNATELSFIFTSYYIIVFLAKAIHNWIALHQSFLLFSFLTNSSLGYLMLLLSIIGLERELVWNSEGFLFLTWCNFQLFDCYLPILSLHIMIPRNNGMINCSRQ